MKFDETGRTLRCVSSQTDTEDTHARQYCRTPYKKMNIFGYKMEENQTYRRGKLADNKTHLNIQFKKYNDPRKHSVKDHNLPIDFKNYCVSRSSGYNSIFKCFNPMIYYISF